jgi:hypothetical protein
MSSWKTLGNVDAQHLVNARLQLHWAALLVAEVGKRLLPPQPDFSQQSFEWVERAGGVGCLTLGEVAGARPWSAGLRLADLTLVLADGEGASRELALSGRTVAEAHAWLVAEVDALLGQPLDPPLESPGYSADIADMPAHPVGTGRRFTLADAAPFVEVARWFANADRLLREIAERESGASPVRCWPHHFDLATLITLQAGDSPEAMRTVGAGLSPGDSSRAVPYFYVTPWPYPPSPKATDLPALAGGGIWNTEDWVGAVLPAGTISSAGSGEGQEGQVREFLESAVAACRRLASVGSASL